MRRALERYPSGTTIVTGDTSGADALAIEVAAELGLRIQAMRKTAGDHERYPGEGWKGLNERMIAMGIDLVLAFSQELGMPGRARGTQHAIDLAKTRGIPVETFREMALEGFPHDGL